LISPALKQTISLGDGNLKGEIALGDFNEDGIQDVAYPVTSDVSGAHSTTVLIFFGDGTGNLIAGPSVTVGQEPHSVIAADFNKDGHLDLAVTNRTNGTVSILLGDGIGNFTLSVTLSVISPELNPQTACQSSQRRTALARARPGVTRSQNTPKINHRRNFGTLDSR